MQYVLEAHRQFIRSKLSSNQNQNLNMIVKYKNTLLPVVPSVHLFTSTLNQSRKKTRFFFGASVSIYSTFVSKHVSTTAEHFPHAKSGILGQIEAFENNTRNKRSKCSRIISKHAETYTQHHFSWTNNIKLYKTPYKKRKFRSRTWDIWIPRVKLGFDY